MKAVLVGQFMEAGSKSNPNTGAVVPYAIIYSGKETVRVNNVDLSTMGFGQEVEIPVIISMGNYGLYVRAVVDND